MKLTADMVEALLDLERNAPLERGPTYTGLARRTYQSLEKRGLAIPSRDGKRWKVSSAGRDALGNT